ncbi:hypothetical protein HA466_0005930 [Hirschfeldia incana]|nr:hypothetical protein HA466_0005930 [Hirschfeldia incana]
MSTGLPSRYVFYIFRSMGLLQVLYTTASRIEVESLDEVYDSELRFSMSITYIRTRFIRTSPWNMEDLDSTPRLKASFVSVD